MKKVIFTAAIMDMCHKGHINLLKTMRDTGKYVIVVLHDDKSCYNIKDKIPIQDIKQRSRNLMITGLVDKVMVTKSTDPADKFAKIIKRYDSEFIRASDNLDFPGKWILEENNIPISYVDYTPNISSTKIREEIR